MNVRFAVPLSDPEELVLLKNAGADEIYLGLLEEKWISLFGNHDSISRRQGAANLHTREQLRKTLAQAVELGISVSLALNGRYTAQQYDYLEELANQFAQWGGWGVIVRDVGLMIRLQNSGLTGMRTEDEDCHEKTFLKREKRGMLRMTASLLTVTVNADGVRFFRDLGADRIVLPRFLTISEMKDIAAQVPEMEYEVMVFGDKCPMIDGLCRSIHGQAFEKASFEGEKGELMFTFDTSCEAHHLCGSLCRDGDPCAACRMNELGQAGINVMKFGGRGTPLAYRLKALGFFERIRNCHEKLRISDMYRETFGHDCCCYYE